MKDDEIKKRILISARDEFLKYGFYDASLRDIASGASLTTGSVYNRFKSKDEIFDALVKKSADRLLNFVKDKEEKIRNINKSESNDCIKSYMNHDCASIVDIIYDDFDAFKLIICKSKGSEYDYYLDSLIDIETVTNLMIVKNFELKTGRRLNITKDSIHILSSSLYKGLFEMVEHDMSKNEASRLEKILSSFFSAGWEEILEG